MRAERHGGLRPARRCLRQHGCVPDRAEFSVAGGRGFQAIADLIKPGLGSLKSLFHTAQAAQPQRGARQRNLHMPAAALVKAPEQCGERAEGHEIGRSVIERLARQGAGLGLAGGVGFGKQN